MEAYAGRLGFDPETGYHHEMVDGVTNRPVQLDDGTWGNEVVETLVPGRPVVTDDEGATWRIAEDADTPHNERYEEQKLVVDSTANHLAELTLEHGLAKANELVDPHHHGVQDDDDHVNGLKFDDDDVAEKVTSHTEAYTP